MEMKTFFQKHVDTVVVLTGILGCFAWINSSLHKMDDRITTVEKRLTVIETVLIMQGYNIKGIALQGEK